MKQTYGLGQASAGSFTMKSQMNDTRTWAWTSPKKCQELNIAISGTTSGGPRLKSVQPTTWTEQAVREKLVRCGVDVSDFGVGKALTLAKLAQEMSAGDSYLVESAKVQVEGEGMQVRKLVRVVDLVAVRLRE